MKMTNKLAMSCAVAVVLIVSAGRLSATVLTFDEINTSNGIAVQLLNYGGFSWAPNIAVYGDPQGPYTPESFPNRVLFNLDTCCLYTESDVFADSAVVFFGAYFSGYDSAGPIYFNLFLDGNLVWTSGFLTPSSTPTFLASGYAGLVDEIGIVGQEGYFVMDNFTYGAVPEPSSLMLLSTGLIATAGVIKRKLFR